MWRVIPILCVCETTTTKKYLIQTLNKHKHVNAVMRKRNAGRFLTIGHLTHEQATTKKMHTANREIDLVLICSYFTSKNAYVCNVLRLPTARRTYMYTCTGFFVFIFFLRRYFSFASLKNE